MMAEQYTLVDNIDRCSWPSLAEAKAYIKESAQIKGTRIKLTQHKPDRRSAIYNCSFFEIKPQDVGFRLLSGGMDQKGNGLAQWRILSIQVTMLEKPLQLQAPFSALTSWVRQQLLRSADIAPQAAVPLEEGHYGQMVYRQVDFTLVDPSILQGGGHIHIDRWIQGTRDGYKALGLVFNVDEGRDRVLSDLHCYLFQNPYIKSQYTQIYGRSHKDYEQRAFNRLQDAPGEILDDIAAYLAAQQ